MEARVDLSELDIRIRVIKKAATQLIELSGGIEALRRNADKILASARMLEIHVSDLLDSEV